MANYAESLVASNKDALPRPLDRGKGFEGLRTNKVPNFGAMSVEAALLAQAQEGSQPHNPDTETPAEVAHGGAES